MPTALPPDAAHALASLLVDALSQGDDALYDSLAELADDPDAITELLAGDVQESTHVELVTVHGKHGNFQRHQKVSTGDDAAGDKSSGGRTPHPDATAHVAELSKLADKVKPSVRERVSNWVAAKYKGLADKYGPTGAKLVLAATVVMAPIPLPGTAFLPVALAEGIRRLKGAMKGKPKQVGESAEDVLDDGELLGAARELLTELYAEHGEEPPKFDEDRAKQAIEHGGLEGLLA